MLCTQPCTCVLAICVFGPVWCGYCWYYTPCCSAARTPENRLFLLFRFYFSFFFWAAAICLCLGPGCEGNRFLGYCPCLRWVWPTASRFLSSGLTGVSIILQRTMFICLRLLSLLCLSFCFERSQLSTANCRRHHHLKILTKLIIVWLKMLEFRLDKYSEARRDLLKRFHYC